MPSEELTEALAEFDRSLALARLGHWREALVATERVLALAPDRIEALQLRGELLQKLGRTNEAAAAFRELATAQPERADAWTGLGTAQLALNRVERALQSFDRALSLQAEDVRAWIGRGAALQRLSRWNEALECYERARRLRPDLVGVLNNRALVLSSLGRWDEAATTYAELLDAAAEFPYALGRLQRARALACDWRDHDALRARIVAGIGAGQPVCDPFSFFAISDSPALQQDCARLYAQRQHPGPGAASPRPRPAQDGKIRLAYLSPDFHEHATAYLTAGLFEKHDRERFEIVAVSFGPDKGGPMRRRLHASFDRFVDARTLADAEVARNLRDLGIHIAIDLAGFTSRNRAGILAARPAPVQIGFLGYPGTMAAPWLDYLIADAYVIPEGQDGFYDESIVRLPHCYQANDDQRMLPTDAGTRAEHGLPEQAFVFCCFNNSYKIGPEIFDRWMRLLAQVPDSVLWLFEDNALVANHLRREAAARGIAPERLVMAPRLAPAAHLARHRHADLFLDTFPYTAHTTGSDALWMGLPLVTCAGESFASRVAGSLLRAAGLPELIAGDFDEYEALALALARDPPRLARLRTHLADGRRTHALFDTDRFRRHLETAYTALWSRHLAGGQPSRFDVPA